MAYLEKSYYTADHSTTKGEVMYEQSTCTVAFETFFWMKSLSNFSSPFTCGGSLVRSTCWGAREIVSANHGLWGFAYLVQWMQLTGHNLVRL